MAGDIGGAKTYLGHTLQQGLHAFTIGARSGFLRAAHSPKIQRIRQVIDHINVHSELEVDGGH